MNLYTIKFERYGGGDSESGIKALLLAESDEQVYEWIASEPTTSCGRIYNSWRSRMIVWDEEKDVFLDEDGNETEEWCDDDGNPESFKARMLRLRGDFFDDDTDMTDAYIGLTLYGWELLKKNVSDDYSELIELGIAYVA